MSRIAKLARPVASRRIASVEADGRDHVQRDAGRAVIAARQRRVDAGVHGVGGEVEHERRLAGAVERTGGWWLVDRSRPGQRPARRWPSVAASAANIGASLVLASSMRRRVTFSRNLTLSLSRTCRCYCKYCAFATHQPHLHAPDEVLETLDRAASRHRVKELLVLTGELPEHNKGVAARLAEYGFDDFVAYVVWVCERALERGLLPHTNLGVLDREDLARLREVTASQGLMLESVSERLMETVHAGSPTKHPARRIETIATAGELKIPFTSGILVGIGETEDERMASLAQLAALHEEHGHLQEVILQNFVPHDSYYGREPAEIAGDAAAEYWRTGVGHGGVGPAARRAGVGLPGHARGHEAADRRGAPADARDRHPGAAQPVGLVARAGRRRRHRPGRTERQRRPHLARASVPVADPGAQAPGHRRLRAVRAAVRVPRVHRRRVGRRARARRDHQPLLVVHPAAGERTGARARRRRRHRAAGDRTRPRRTGADPRRADRAVRRAPAGRDRGHAAGGRRAAARGSRATR